MLHERRNGILEKIMRTGMVKIADLAAEYDVSIETIRRDLDYLEKHGFLKRVYGGAVSSKTYGNEPAYESREVLNYAEKLAIGAATIPYIDENSVIYLDVGTTVLEVARCLYTKSDIIVVTNATKAAKVVMSGKGNRVVLLGGSMREGEMSVAGTMTQNNLSLFRFDTAILGVGGLTMNGMTDYHIEEASVRRTVIEQSNKVIAVADHSKFGTVCMNWICPVDKISMLITDWQTPARVIAEYRDAGVEVVVASPVK